MGNILWLASYPKSGNTWVRAFVANLLANDPKPVPLAELHRYADDESLAEHYTALTGLPAHALDLNTVCALRPRVQEAIASRGSGTSLVKTHNYWGKYDDHWLQDPRLTVGAIHIVRNPLDVVVSMSHHFGLTLDAAIDFLGNEETAIGSELRGVGQVLSSWRLHVASWSAVDSAAFLTVRYEDLLEKPGKWFTRIAKLLGAGDDRQRIERAIRFSSFDQLSANERRAGFVEASDRTDTRFFRSGRQNQWRTALDKDQVRRVVEAHRDQMKRFKYAAPGL